MKLEDLNLCEGFEAIADDTKPDGYRIVKIASNKEVLEPLPVNKKELIALIEAKTGKDIDGRTSEAKVIEMARENNIEV